MVLIVFLVSVIGIRGRLAISGGGSSDQVTYSSPSGVTWSSVIRLSRYSSRTARNRATTS